MQRLRSCILPADPPDDAVPIQPRGGESAPGAERERTEEHAPAPDPPPPSLSSDSHNCNGGPPASIAPAVAFTPSSRRTAFALQLNVGAFVQRFGVERVGFLTLTFADHVLCPKEAQRRLHSLTTGVLVPRYGAVIRIFERQKSGRIHYHLLVNVGADIRTGVDFAALERRDYRTAGTALRAEWAFWRATAKAYGFGRTELLPVIDSSEAISRYLGKYISKHLDARTPQDRRVRLVSYCGTRVASTRFAWATGSAALWRARLKAFVHMLYDSGALGSPTVAAMRLKFGPRWAHYWRDNIATFPLPEDLTDAERV